MAYRGAILEIMRLKFPSADDCHASVYGRYT